MSEKTEEAPKKKKGKLPIIIALVAVLGGGGFFAMKGKGKEEDKVPELKLGKTLDIKDEILVNLKDSNSTYLRTTISLVLAEGTEPTKVEPEMSEILDAINMRLMDKSLSELRTLEGKRKLKRELAADINEVIGEPEAEAKTEKKEESKEEAKVEFKVPEDWDSDKGPVLKVLFRSFATQ